MLSKDIEDMRFSPDGKWLSVGTKELINIYDWQTRDPQVQL